MVSFLVWLEQKNKKICCMLRGISGSGKSTKARSLLVKLGGTSDGHIISTDNFWIPETRKKRRAGEFVSDTEEQAEYKKNFDPTKLQQAHVQTHIEFKRAVDQGITPLIVDNTNVKKESLRPYADYAEKAGYEIRIEYPDSDIWKQYSPFLADKRKNDTQLIKMANALHKSQKHGLPFDAVMKQIDSWENTPTLQDILGREPTKR